jgi:acetyl esterase/lipase
MEALAVDSMGLIDNAYYEIVLKGKTSRDEESIEMLELINSTLYYKALKRHGVKASLHIYPSGGHGWFSRESWVYRKVWLETLYEWIVAQ